MSYAPTKLLNNSGRKKKLLFIDPSERFFIGGSKAKINKDSLKRNSKAYYCKLSTISISI